MANRLPTVGGDSGNWGTLLNAFLSTEHNPLDGTHGLPISQLNSGAPAQVNDIIQIVRGTTSFKVNVGDVAALSLPIGGGTLTGALTIKPASNVNTIRVLDWSNGDVNSRKWNENIATFVNTGGGNNNNTWQMGYNNAAGGGVLDVTEHAWYIQMESKYNPSADPGIPTAEYHLDLYTPNNALSFRPFQYNALLDGSWFETTYTADKVNFFDHALAQYCIITPTGITSKGALAVSTNNVQALKQINAAGSAYYSLGYVDSSNEIVYGDTAAAYVCYVGKAYFIGTYLGFYSKAPVTRPTKAGHNNWAAISDVTSALAALGLIDVA